LPVSKIRTLLALKPSRSPAHRVRVRGIPYVPAQGGMAVMDETGQIAVGIGQFAPDPNAKALDVGGFTTGSLNKTLWCRIVLWDHAFPRQAHKRNASRHI